MTSGTATRAEAVRSLNLPSPWAHVWALGAAVAYGGFAWAAVRIRDWPAAAAALPAALSVLIVWRLAGALRSYRLAIDPRRSALQAAALLTPFYVVAPCLLDPFLSGRPQSPQRIATVMLLPWAGVVLCNWVLGARQEPQRPGRFLALGVAASWIMATLLSLQRYIAFGDPELGQDTAYFTQCMWTTLHGRFFSGPVLSDLLYSPPIPSHFAAHFSPILLAVLPFFAALPHALTLVAVRNAAVVALVLPAYRIARRRLQPGPALAAAFLPLAHPAVWYQTQHALGFLPFAAFPLLMAVDATLEGPRWRAWLWGVGALAVREDVAFVVFALGVWATIVRRDPRHLVFCLVSALWFAAAQALIMPMFGETGGRAVGATVSSLGDTPLAITLSVVRRPFAALRMIAAPAAALYLVRILRPTMFLPVFTPLTIAAVPTIFVNLLVGSSPFGTLDLRYQHAVIPASILSIAAMFVVGSASYALARRMRDHWLDAARLQYIALVALFCAAEIGAFDVVSPDLPPRYAKTAEDDAAWRAIAQIRTDDSVAAAGAYLPALARRQDLYLFDRLRDYPGSPAPDAVLVDSRVNRLGLDLDNRERYRLMMEQVQSDARYSPVFDREGIVLFRRNP